MKYKYFPGCSIEGSGRACEESTRAVFTQLDVELEELEDWNCCGATAYMAVDEQQALALAARNLALADSAKCEHLATPCSGCFLALNKTQHTIRDYPEIGDKVKGALKEAGLQYTGNVRVRHMLDILVNDVGLDAVKKRVTDPLSGIKIAAYYGCQTTRPYGMFDDQHHPTSIDRLCEALGAKAVNYPLKTKCCGASQMGVIPEVAQDLVFQLLREARRNGADVIVTVCPLCQFNLDSYQKEISGRYHEEIGIPILYYTQLVGLAFGLLPEMLGLPRNITWDAALLGKQAVAATA